jgi:diketogulonate reductase-like aldo/keto reductase
MVKEAIKLGCTHIDTAQLYKNEDKIGEAIKEVDRSKLFITTKIHFKNIKKGKESIIKSIEESLKNLQTNYIDLVLLHKPILGKNVQAYKILEQYYPHIIRNIGVSNFKITDLEEILKQTTIKPLCNQIEISPFLSRNDIVEYCSKNNIIIVAHSSLIKGVKFDDITIRKISKKYNKTPAQILLRWGQQKNFVVLPRTSKLNHLIEDFDLNFTISDSDTIELDSLDENYATHPNLL